MKRFIFIIFLFIGITAKSQILISLLFGDKLNSDGLEFGLEGGLTYSTITSLESNRSESNFYLGFYFDMRLKNQWSLDTGILVKSTLGNGDLTEADLRFLDAKIYENKGDYSQKLSYFILPALIKYKFDNHIYLETGPQFALLRKSWVEYNFDLDGNSGRIKETNTDLMNRIDVGVAAGAGFRLLEGLGWTIGFKYYYGFIDVYKSASGSKNSSFFLKMNVPIGLSQKSKAEILELKEINKEKKAKKKQEKKTRKENENKGDN